MKINCKISCLITSGMINSCCIFDDSEMALSKSLDEGNVRGSIEIMDNYCVSRIPDIKLTKAMLIFRLYLEEKDIKEREKLKSDAIGILESEVANGSERASQILEIYRKEGDLYLYRFPWGGLLGPGLYPNSPRY